MLKNNTLYYFYLPLQREEKLFSTGALSKDIYGYFSVNIFKERDENHLFPWPLSLYTRLFKVIMLWKIWGNTQLFQFSDIFLLNCLLNLQETLSEHYLKPQDRASSYICVSAFVLFLLSFKSSVNHRQVYLLKSWCYSPEDSTLARRRNKQGEWTLFKLTQSPSGWVFPSLHSRSEEGQIFSELHVLSSNLDKQGISNRMLKRFPVSCNQAKSEWEPAVSTPLFQSDIRAFQNLRSWGKCQLPGVQLGQTA